MPKSRPPYPAAFRQQMVELVRSGRTPGELAREFEPSAEAIRNWSRRLIATLGERTDGLSTEDGEELRRLRRENRRLTPCGGVERASSATSAATAQGRRISPRELRAPSHDPACRPVRLVAHASPLEDQRGRRLQPPACLGRIVEDDQLVEAGGRLPQRYERLPVPLAHLLRIDPRPVPRAEAMAPQRLLVRLDAAVYPLDVDGRRLGADEVPADAVAGRLRALDQHPGGLVRVGRFDAELVPPSDRLVDLVGNQRVGAPARPFAVPVADPVGYPLDRRTSPAAAPVSGVSSWSCPRRRRP